MLNKMNVSIIIIIIIIITIINYPAWELVFLVLCMSEEHAYSFSNMC